MKLKALLLSIVLAALLGGSLWAVRAQQAGVPGCGAGLGTSAIMGSYGVPGGCASGVPTKLSGLILLSNSSIPSTAALNTVIGTLSVTGGTGSYTYTLTSNPGSLFSIVGSSLEVNAALTVGSDPITIQANNGAGSIITQPFTITVTSTCTVSLNFSQACNSMYIF